mgnify:CR=1 FL=1
MMSLDSFVEIAEGEVGYTAGSNGYTKYGEWYGLPTSSWCAMFVSWCANEADILTTSETDECPYVPKESTVTEMKRFYSNSRRALNPVLNSSSPNYPQVGDLAVIRSEGYSSDNHIGIIVDVNGSSVTTVEGNTSRKVKRVTYTDLYASGFGTITMLLSNHVSW